MPQASSEPTFVTIYLADHNPRKLYRGQPVRLDVDVPLPVVSESVKQWYGELSLRKAWGIEGRAVECICMLSDSWDVGRRSGLQLLDLRGGNLLGRRCDRNEDGEKRDDQ